MTRKLAFQYDTAALPEWRAFSGTRAYRMARAVQAAKPALANVPLETINGMILPLDGLRDHVQYMRDVKAIEEGWKPITRKRVNQMCNTWAGEGWSGTTAAGSGYWLTNSVDVRITHQHDIEAPAAKSANGLLGGRPRKD